MQIAMPKHQQRAPDFSLIAHNATPIRLADFQNKSHVVLFFVRTYTCYSCREHVRHLGRMYNQFKEQNAEVLVILNADMVSAQGYADVTQAPFLVLADPTHQIYELFGLGKHFLLSTRTGSVVVDKTGAITYIKSAANPWGWRHESTTLLEHLRGLNLNFIPKGH